MQGCIRARRVSVRIRAQGDVNSLSRIAQVEMGSLSQTARANRAQFSLETATASHIEFIDNAASRDIGDSYVQGEKRSACAEIPEKETSERTSAIHAIEVTIHQPA